MLIVAKFTIATNRKGSKDGQTDFINCVAWRQTAEFIGKYFAKGSSICVVGEIQTRTWTDKDGGKRYATEVIVSEALFVDSKSDAGTAPTFSTAQTAGTPNFEDIAPDDPLPF